MTATKWTPLKTDYPPTFSFRKEGMSIEGQLIDKRHVESDKFESGSADIYLIDTPKGTKSVFGSGHLNWLMANVAIETAVRIKFEKWDKMRKGKKVYKVKRFAVDIDEATVPKRNGRKQGKLAAKKEAKDK